MPPQTTTSGHTHPPVVNFEAPEVNEVLLSSELSSEPLPVKAEQSICQSLIQPFDDSKILSLVEVNNLKILQVEASLAKLVIAVNTNSARISDVDSKLAEINDQLSNIYEILSVMHSLSGLRKQKPESVIYKVRSSPSAPDQRHKM